jgi:hypothetical protein
MATTIISLALSHVKSKAYTGFYKKLDGHRVYLGQDEREAAVKLLCAIAERRYGVRLVPAGEVLPPCSHMLHAALAAFRESIADGAYHPTWARSYRSRIDRVGKLLGADRPLSAIGHEALAGLVNHFTALPVSARTKRKILPTTAKGLIKTALAFFRWAQDTGRWEGPSRWEKHFRLRGRLRTGQTYGQIRMMTVADLAKVYRLATPRMQCLILTALNIGGTQWELSVLSPEDVDLEAGRVSKARPKTGVWGSWKLWPETIQALKTHMASKGERALLTEAGKALVEASTTGRTDRVEPQWEALLKRAGVAHMGWKYLRKLGAQLVREVADVETVQLYLAHKGQSVAELHYSNPVHEKLDAALAKVRGKLQPLFAENGKLRKTA